VPREVAAVQQIDGGKALVDGAFTTAQFAAELKQVEDQRRAEPAGARRGHIERHSIDGHRLQSPA
jgi:hypothetical protein